MRDEALVRQILEAVVAAVQRAGDVEDAHRLGSASIATASRSRAWLKRSASQALAVHGRTRACIYRGEAEYETIRAIKQSVCNSDFRQWRHRLTAQSEART